MDRSERVALLWELINERDKLTRLWGEVQARPEKTLEDAKRCYEAQSAWEALFKRFVAEGIENGARTALAAGS